MSILQLALEVLVRWRSIRLDEVDLVCGRTRFGALVARVYSRHGGCVGRER